MTRGERVISWIEHFLRVPQGKLIGKPVQLQDFQKNFILDVYDHEVPVRTAILSMGRKGGKTTLIAMLVIVHLCGPEALPNSEIYSAAQSKDQAAIVYNYAEKMVRMSPAVSDMVTCKTHLKELHCSEVGTFYKALSADAKTKFGLNPALIIHDELGQVVGPRSDLYDALETATGAQENPLSFIISTQASTDGDLLSILIDDALSGSDPSILCHLYCADKEGDPFTEETIKKANPGYGTIQNKEEVLRMSKAAQRMPSKEASYKNLVLNLRISTRANFVLLSTWNLGNDTEPKPMAEAVKLFGGLDLSEINDLTARIMIGEAEDGKIEVYPTFWLPEKGLRERAKNDRVPYDLWAEQGFIRLVPGKIVSYEHVAKDMAELFGEQKETIQKIGFDRWNFRHFKPWLLKAGFDEYDLREYFEEVGMGTATMSPALRTLETWILNSQLRHGSNPVLAMCMTNAVVSSPDPAMRKLDKGRSNGRIDGAVALAIAASVAGEYAQPEEGGMTLL